MIAEDETWTRKIHKIPSFKKVSEPNIHKEARQKDGETRAARKQVFDKKHRVREQIIRTVDQANVTFIKRSAA